ncbi:MAG TPA: NAD(P)/FAD-dependent oxidoreductase [Terriglobales bacterium]|nr:NAD(P)/FAD-dependent oxidoreductase [Terriglobales bacterium]
MRADLSRSSYDAVIVGSGPNGLAAATTIAQTGRSVLVIEAQEEIGGGTRSAELTLPGFIHDVCSAVHPMGIASPFFRSLPLEKHGLEWIHPPAPVAHPLDSGAVLIERSVEETAANLGADAEQYVNLFRPFVADWTKLEQTLLGPPRLPQHPLAVARFGLSAWRSAYGFAQSYFKDERTRAAFAGMAAHSIVPLENLTTAAFGLVFTVTAHAVGWPIARGGSRSIAGALASYLRSIGGEIVTGMPVTSLDQLPKFRVALFDITPRQLLNINRLQFPSAFHQNLQRFRYGPGVCKVDWALDAPIPWKFPDCARAGTVHVGGTLEEIAASERAPWQGTTSATPFVLLAQPTLFDPTRAPAGKHIAWAYAHVPNGSNLDISDAIENQVERFAPGFRNRVLRRSVMLSSDMEQHNANLVGGDIAGGAALASQLLLRPTWRMYGTPMKDIYLCSSSTPPGAGVHGMCGHFAALKALKAL